MKKKEEGIYTTHGKEEKLIATKVLFSTLNDAPFFTLNGTVSA